MNDDPKIARCLDRKWRYTRSEATDISVLFRKVKQAMKAEEDSQVTAPNVKRIRAEMAQRKAK